MILLISGSLRRDSFNTALLRCAINTLPDGVGYGWLERLASLPLYNEDDDSERPPAAVEQLRHTIAMADAVLIATPEHNGTIPSALKNAVDWASRPFPGSAWQEKPVAVIGASTSIFGGVWAQADLRRSLGVAGAQVIDAELAIGSAEDAFEPSGALRDPGHASALHDIFGALRASVGSDDQRSTRRHDPRRTGGGTRTLTP